MATFNLWDYMGGNYSVTINDLPSGYDNWWASLEASRFKTGAVVFNGYSTSNPSLPNARELRLIDLETGRVMAGRTLQPGEIFIQSVGRDTTYHIGQVINNALVVKGYDYSLTANASSLTTQIGSTHTFLPPVGQTASFFQSASITDYAPPQAGLPTALFQSWAWNPNLSRSEKLLYTAVDGGSLQPLTLPPSDLQYAWYGNAFIDEGFVWIDVSSQDHQSYYRASLSSTSNSFGVWVEVTDEDDFWSAWSYSKGQDTVVRDGDYAYDLSGLVPAGASVHISDTRQPMIELPSGRILVRAEIGRVLQDLQIDIFYEHWFVFANGQQTPVTQKAFNAGDGLSLWSLQSDDPASILLVDEHLDFVFSNGRAIDVTQNRDLASTIYKVV